MYIYIIHKQVYSLGWVLHVGDNCGIILTVLHKARVFFYFSFYRPSLPNFFKIRKKIKEIFFLILFLFSLRLMPVLEFNYVFPFVFSTAARLIKFKIKFIWTIFQLNKNRRKHKIVFPSILIQLENVPYEYYFYFVLRR